MQSKELGKMANEVHKNNIQTRNDGGPGSGPRQGSGGKVPKSMTIQKAAMSLHEKGFKLGPASTDLKAGVTSYEVTKNGRTTKMTAKEVSKLALS